MARAATKKAPTKTEDSPIVLKGVKGFDKDLACEPEPGKRVQYKVGETYVHEGEVERCVSGFHAVTGHPLAVFNYYPPAGSRFCLVEQSGKIDTDDDDDKTCSEILKVGREIGIAGLVAEAISWVQARSHPEGEAATGDRGAASATGDRGAASATGDWGAASATGYQGAASATGDRGAASATGDRGAASATGYQGAASATGDRGAALASGFEGRVSGKNGNALFAVERKTWDGPIVSVACGIVGKDGIKPDTWYACVGGKLVEA